MIQILEFTSGNLVATRATGKLTESDYNKILPLLVQKEKEHKKICWYFEMDDFEGWDLKASLKDMEFDFKYANQMEKIAMVGDKKWEKWLTDFMKPFTSAEIKFFDPLRKEEAKVWITE